MSKSGLLVRIAPILAVSIGNDVHAQQVNPNFELNEVVVTAQKREESLQKVPIAISVLSGEDLDTSSAEGLSEVLNRLPGVATTTAVQGGGTQVAVRGVTAGGPLFNGSSPIAYYLDNVPFGLVKTAVVPDSNAYDLSRVEVLRGPQGTMYGASAQNGVVRVLTKDADLESFKLKGRTSGATTEGGDESYRGDLAVNVPLVSGKLAARAVVGYQDLGGWIDRPDGDDANDGEILNMRLKLNAQPTERFSIGLSAWRLRSDFGAPSLADDQLQQVATLDESIETDYDVFSLRLGYDSASVSIASITGYLDYSNEGSLDLVAISPFLAGVSILTALDSQVFSQEVTVSSNAEGSWRWSMGGMYRDGEDRLVQELIFLPAPVDFTDTSESVAVYGELTRVFSNGRFELTGGLRYFEDDVTQIENIAQIPGTPVLPPESDTFSKTTPRVVLAWHPSDQTNIYSSYSQGFRSGFNQNANVRRGAPGFPPLKADTLTNYEIGAKGNLANGRIAYDAAIYFIDWQDVQQTLDVDFGGVPVTALVNGESASGLGVDFGFTARPIDDLEFGINLSWNDLTMDSDVVAFPPGSPPEGVLLFSEGDRLSLSPEWTVGASAEYSFALGGGGMLGRLAASANYISEQTQRTVAGVPPTLSIGRGDEILTARTSFSVESENRWAATLFVDNVTDEQDVPIRNFSQIPYWDMRIRPRTIGLQFEFGF